MPNLSRSSEVTKLMELHEIQRLRREFSRAGLYAYCGVLVKGPPKARKRGLSVHVTKTFLGKISRSLECSQNLPL